MVEKVYKIKDVFNLFAGGDVNHSHFSEYKTSAYIFCVYSNSLADHGLYGYTDVPKYSGDSITITGRGSIGHAEYRPFDFDAIIRLLVLIPKYKDIIDSRYVTELINSYVKFPLESTGVPQLTVPQIENIEISLPTIEVQRKIANALSDMDSMISLLEKLIAKYKSIKAACLQQMFPQNGETVPRMRLPGFTDDWEQRKLGDISEIKTGPFGSTLHADDYVSDGTPIITTEHFKTGALPRSKNGLPQVSDSDYKRLTAYTLDAGDIVFSRVGSVDINALITPFQSNWLFSGRVLRVRPQTDVSSQFLHTRLETEGIKTDIRTRAVGQTMPSINTEILKITPLVLPSSVAEQEQIGSYFAALDHLITLRQRKLEKVQKIKQGMMQQLLTGKIRLV